MTNQEMAEAYIAQAQYLLQEARNAYLEKRWNICMRRSQESIEFATKAVLRLLGIEPPRWHDVSSIIFEKAGVFPEWFQQAIAQIAEASRKYRRQREISFYGDELTGRPPQSFYEKEDAEKAIADATFVITQCQRLVKETTNN